MTLEALEGRRLLAVTGTVSIDINGNGETDLGEQGLAGAIVYLDADRDGQLDVNEVSARTQDDGTYRLESPPVGRYELRQQRLDGFLPTGFSTVVTVRAGGGDQTDVNLTAAPLASIEGIVYEDANRDGGKNGVEIGSLDSLLTGGVVVLTDSTNTVVTDAFGDIVNPAITVSGKYEFNNLLPAGVTLRTPDGEVSGPESYVAAMRPGIASQTFPVSDRLGPTNGIALDRFSHANVDAGPIAVGDFNGDGRPDIAVGVMTTTRVDRIDIFYNRTESEGTVDSPDEPLGARFEAGPEIDVPGITPNLTSLVVGDFSGDGLVDLAIASSGVVTEGASARAADDYVAILYGETDSAGEFSGFSSPLFLTNSLGNAVSGNAGIQVRSEFREDLFIEGGPSSQTLSPVQLTTGQLGRQTLPYLVSINQGRDNVSVMHPTFAGADVHLASGGTDVRALVVEDLNQDGFDDIVVGSFNGNVRVYSSKVIGVDDPATIEDELVIDYEFSDHNAGGNVVEMVVVGNRAGDAPTLVVATVAEQFGTNEENLVLYSFDETGFQKNGGLRTPLVPSGLDVWNTSSGVTQTLVVADRTTDRVQYFSVTDDGFIQGVPVSTRPALPQDDTPEGDSPTELVDDGMTNASRPPFRDHHVTLMDLSGDQIPELISSRGAAESMDFGGNQESLGEDEDFDGVIDEVQEESTETLANPGGVFVVAGLAGTLNVSPSLGDRVFGGDFGVTFEQPSRLISGRIFNDVDADSADNDGEFGLSGATVFAENRRTGESYQQVVGDDGVYQFAFADLSGLETDSLTVTATMPGGFRNTTGLTRTIPLQSDAIGPDFGFTESEASGRDYGDAPSSYQTLIASGGPSHTVTDSLFLGESIDAEPFPLVSLTATGDDRTGSNDDDGVAVRVPLIAGSTGEMDVLVTNTTGGNGYLRVWFDLNLDGDFTDDGELIVADRVITGQREDTDPNEIEEGEAVLAAGQGMTTVSIDLPADFSFESNGILDTFARFRYSPVPGVELGGHVENGEVEDYAMQIFENEEAAVLAFNDRAVVARNAIDSPLNVLANDASSLAHPLSIDPNQLSASLGRLTTTATPAGTQVLLYTPPSGYVGPVTLTYGVLDRYGRTDMAEVAVEVFDRIGKVTAVDDTVVIEDPQLCQPSRLACEIDVLANDSFDGSRPLRIRSVNDGSRGGTLTVTGEQTLVYRPAQGFVGVEEFTYTAESSADETSAPSRNAYASGKVTVVVGDPTAMSPVAAIDLQVIEPNSQTPVSSVAIGDLFRVRVSVDDLRELSTESVQGVASAFLDLVYPSRLFQPVDLDRTDGLPVSIQFGDRFEMLQELPESFVLSENVFDEFGQALAALDASTTSDQLEMLSHEGPVELFTVTMRAVRSGTGVFQVDPADEGVVSLLDDSGDLKRRTVSNSEIRFGSVELQVVAQADIVSNLTSAGIQQSAEAEDVNLDNQVTALDALMVINELNRIAGSNGRRASGEFAVSGFDPSLDVNQDGRLTSVDALRVINFLNQQAESERTFDSEPQSVDEVLSPVWALNRPGDAVDDERMDWEWLDLLAEEQSSPSGVKTKIGR